jgi:hypothetical protein
MLTHRGGGKELCIGWIELGGVHDFSVPQLISLGCSRRNPGMAGNSMILQKQESLVRAIPPVSALCSQIFTASIQILSVQWRR